MMAGTYVPIQSVTLASSAASVTFSSIPQTYTDLVVRVSARRAESGRTDFRIALNADTSSGSFTYLRGSGSAATSGQSSATYIRVNDVVPSSAETASTFGSVEFYVPNYAGSAYKPVGAFGAGENNATAAYISAVAGLYSQTTAVSSIVLSPTVGTFDSGCTFHLYGIKNS